MDDKIIKYEDLGDYENNNSSNVFNKTGDALDIEYAKFEQDRQWNNIRQTLKAVSEMDGDKVGEIQKFKEQFNLPADFELNNDDETFNYIKKRKREEYILNQNFAKINPILARQLEDPRFAALAHDNIEHLQEYYTTGRALTMPFRWIYGGGVGLQQGIHKGWLTNERGLLGYQLMTGDPDNEYHQGDRIKKFIAADIFGAFSEKQTREEKLARIKEIDAKIAMYNEDGVNWIEAGAYYAGQWSRQLPAAATTGLVTAKINAKLGAIAGSVVPGKGTAIGGVLGATTGLPAAFNYMAINSYMVEGGNSYLDAITRVGGLSHEDAARQAHMVGFLAAGVERIGLPFLFKGTSSIASKGLVKIGTNKWLQGSLGRSGLGPKLESSWVMLNKRFLRRSVKDSLSDKFQQLTVYSATQDIFKDIATNILSETSTEVVQELINIIGFNIAAEMATYETNPVDMEEGMDRIKGVMWDTFRGMVTFGIVTSGGGYMRTANNVRQSDSDQQYIEQMLEITKDDKTKKRNKNLWQNYMDLVGDRFGVKDWYVDAETFQQQLDENDISMEQLELFDKNLSSQLRKATDEGLVGKSIKITQGDYLANIAGSDFHNILRPHLRLGNNTYSQKEFQEVYKIKDKMLDQTLKDIKTKTAEFKESQREANAYKAQIKEQLVATGKYTKEVATQLTHLPLAFALTFAKRNNMNIKDFINKYFYNVIYEGKPQDFGNDFFNQNGSVKTDSALFKNWFGKSKMKNADGTPQVLYHGTTSSFDRYNLKNTNRPDIGIFGRGIYLSLNENDAKTYKQQKNLDPDVMPSYVRLENPYRETNPNIKEQLQKGGKGAKTSYRKKLIQEGHDGVLVVNPDTNEVTEVVVFDSNAVKSVNDKDNWSREIDNIYEQQLETFEQRGQQEQGNVVPQAVYQIAKIVENFEFAKSKPFKTNRQFKLEIQNRVKKEAKKNNVDLSKFTVQAEKYLVQTLLADARYALIENPNAVGWYDEKVTKAVRILALKYPKVATDKRHGFIFKWALATTSNGIKVDKNFEYATDVYEKWLMSEQELGEGKGRLPELMLNELGEETGGESRAAMEKSFRRLNDLLDKKPFAELEKFMRTKHTGKEVQEFVGLDRDGKQIKIPSDFSLGDIVYGSAIIGPKIGNGFFANLYGNYEQLTVDRWAMRTWGRMTGTLVLDRERLAKQKRKNIKAIIRALSKEQKKAFEKLIGRKLTLGDIDNVALAIKNKSAGKGVPMQMKLIARFDEDQKNYDTFVEIMGKPRKGDETVSLGDLLRKQGNGLAKDNDGQKETPSGPVERRNIVKVFSQVLEILNKEYPNLTMADLQALVWYPEKKLYDSAKLKEAVVETGYEDNEAPDYANAAASFVATMGISDDLIQSTIKEVDDELQSNEQSTGIQRDDDGRRVDEGIRETYQQQDTEDANIDEKTGLPINPDGTVTLYHHTSRKNAEAIRSTGELRSAGEPDVYVTTRAITDIGYGNTAVPIRVDPRILELNDEFPNGRKDFNIRLQDDKGNLRYGGSIAVKVGEFYEQRRDSKGPKGRFDPKSFTTLLNKDSDISTFFHETGHYMLSVMEDIVLSGDAPADIINDFNVLLDFWGVEDIDTWSKLSIEQKKEYHEAFALNFEIYLHTGKVPVKKQHLRRIFRDFARFLEEVYQDIKYNLNNTYRALFGKDLPVLTDEVRSVMDRMLSTNQDIILANEMYGMKAMFQTKEQSGMSDSEWANYQQQLQEAFDESKEILNQKSMAQLSWFENAKSKYLADLQRKHKKTYKKVEAEVTEEVENETVYRLINYLKKGETRNDKGEKIKVQSGNKISIESVKQLVPFHDMKFEMKELGYGKSGMLAKEGQSIENVADLFGYKSGLDMIDAILSARDIKEVIKERTEKRMLEEYSELVDEKQIQLGLQEALHNEARARFISLELKFLSKSTQPVRLQIAAANEAALDILANTKLEDIRVSDYTRDEEKARKRTEEHLGKKDPESLRMAVEAKRSQLIANQLAKESVEILKRYDNATKKNGKFQKFLQTDKQFKDKNNKSKRNMFLIDAGRAILYSYGIAKQRINVQEKMKQIQEYNPFTYEQLEPIILKASQKSGKTELTSLTVSEFYNVEDTLDTLWYQSLRDEQIRQGNKLVAFQEALQPILDLLDKRISQSPAARERQINPPGKSEAVNNGWKQKLHKFALTLGSNLQRMESFVDLIDGADEVMKGFGSAVLQLKDGKLGYLYNTLFYPIKEALNEYRQQQYVITREYTELVAALDFGSKETKITAFEFNEVSEESTPYTFGTDSDGIGKVELLGAMLHTGNDSNLKKLLLGRGWGSLNEDGTLNRTHWDNFVQRMKDEGFLTKTDYIFMQAVWDLNQKMLPLLQQAHRELNGYYFKTVEATPIVNEFGTFRGGYVPAKGDPNMTKQDVEITVEQLEREFRLSLPMVENGMTKERNENFAQPLSLNLNYMTKHIDDSLRYAYVQPKVKDALKIVNNKEFQKKLQILNPTKLDYLIKPWLQTVVSQRTFAPTGLGPEFDQGLNTTRKKGGMAVMFFNLKNAIEQYTGVFPAMLKATPVQMISSLQNYMQDRQGTMQAIADLSPFMADRQLNQIFDIQDRLNELLVNPNRFDRFKDWSTKHAYFLQQTFQNQVDAVVWMAVYNQTHQKLPTSMSDIDVQTEAIKQADAAVRMTQDSLLPEDRAGFQNWNPIIQSISQFTGYFNNIANLDNNQYQKITRDLGFNNKGKGTEQLFYMYLYAIMMPAVIAGLIGRTFAGNLFLDEDDDGMIADDMMKAVLGDLINYKKAFVPVFGNALLIPINQFDDKPWNDSMVSSPSIELLTRGGRTLVKIPVDLYQGKGISGYQIRDISALVTIISGIPVTPVGRTGGYLLDVYSGKVNPENTADFIRGTLTGKSSKGSRR